MKNKTEAEKRFDRLVMLLTKNGVNTEVESARYGDFVQSHVLFTDCETNDVFFDFIINDMEICTVNYALLYICKYREDILKELYEKFDEEHNTNIDYIEYILTKLTRRDILGQLAEEASELSQVANGISTQANYVSQYSNKLIRASEKINNVTPVKKEDCVNIINTSLRNIRRLRVKRLEEEYGDVNMCMDLLYHIDGGKPIEEFETLNNPKWERWAKRLGFISFDNTAKKSNSGWKPWGIRHPIVDTDYIRIINEAKEKECKIDNIGKDD